MSHAFRSPSFERSPAAVASSAEAAAAAPAERAPRRRRLSFSAMLERVEAVKAEEAAERAQDGASSPAGAIRKAGGQRFVHASSERRAPAVLRPCL